MSGAHGAHSQGTQGRVALLSAVPGGLGFVGSALVAKGFPAPHASDLP